jgi:hypothetical protein
MATPPPPEEPGRQPPPPPPPPQYQTFGQPGYGGLGRGPTTGAILPVPGNAELVVYLLAALVLAIIWAASDQLEAHGFSTLFTILTVGFLLSRGIAKASRVLEQ